MKAVIMAGGEGSRLRPLTCGIPKPMVPILNKPVMEHIIGLLRKFDITDIAATLWYLPSEITDYFEDGRDFSVKLNYYIETSPLGTGGSVLNTEDFLDGTFIVISGDAMTDINLSQAVEFHRSRGSKATLVLKREPIPLEYGIVITDEYGSINKFLEKPSWGEVFSDTINTGIYILEPEVLSYYKKGENFDFSKDLFPRLLNDNIPMFGYITDEYWCDIGDLNSYKQTHFDILSGKVNIGSGYISNRDIIIGKNTIISSSAKILPPVYIGANCIIRSGAVISNSVIGDGCTIGENTSLKRSILWNKSTLGRNNQCRSTILCSGVNLHNNINLFEDSVIGPGCTLSDNVTLKPCIKLWPFKRIKEDSIVNKNLIWGTKASRVLFGERGISGEFNIEITPEYASLLGAAYSSSINKTAPLIISSDDSPPSRLIKESIISGALSSGSKVIDIGDAVIPLNRFGVKLYNGSGGIHVSTGWSDGRLRIEFINEAGGNIDRKAEKKVENLFSREDFERCSIDTVCSAVKIQNFEQLYLQNIEPHIKNLIGIRNSAYRILIASPSEITLNIAALLLKNIGCSVTKDYWITGNKSMDDYAKHIGDIIKANNNDIGVIFSENGENIILIDETGLVIDKEKYPILASLITLKSGNAEKLIIPYMSTVNIERLAQKYNTEIIRAKSAFSELINTVLKQPRSDNAPQLQYILYFDGIYAVAKILDFLIENSTTLHILAAEIPPIHIRTQKLNCDFEQRGSIIRRLIEEGKSDSLELFDGIRLSSEKGWSLILPDNERSVFNIYTEGFSEEYADELSVSIADKLKRLIVDKDD